MRLGFLSFTLLAAAARGQQPLTPETLLLARIKYHNLLTLQKLPNYTCRETIERSFRNPPGRKFRLLDLVRLEVAFVGNRELYGWPGATRFEETDITDMVKGGAIGNGIFGMHAKSILSGQAAFTHKGLEEWRGRPAVRFDYTVARNQSGFNLRVGEANGIAGYHGSMWADPKSIDLIRVEVVTDDIPAHVPIKESTTSIEYSRLKIGEGEFLLPTGAEMVMIDLKGKEDRNRTEFSGCRQYSGESTISFAEAPEPGTAPPTPETVGVELPIGLEFTAYLDVALNAQTAIGDEVKATIQQTVKKSKVTVVPKGATLTGRVVSMLPANNAVLVGIDFQTLEFPGARAAVNPKLTGVGEFTAARVNSRNAQYALYDGPPMPGAKRAPAAMFYVRGSRLNIPAGLRMAFRLDKPENKKLEESK